MSAFQPFFAQDILPTDVIPGAWRWMGLTFKELLLLLGAVGFVTLLVVLWAVYLRKRPRQHQHHHHHHHSHSSPAALSSSENGEPDPGEEKRYRRKRRRRREHRPRNPTLAETGGLPPLRAERPSDPLP
jgi:hypothetical protein